MQYILILIALILLQGCSFKTPTNAWQYKSATAFSSYTQNFLADNEVLADNDLDRAIEHAKQGADLKQLAQIYLGKCALNISVGITDTCEEYKNMEELITDAKLKSYFALLTSSLKEEDIQHLPSQYQDFSLYLHEEDYIKANTSLLSINKATSILLCASLLEDKISTASGDFILKTASYNGYKKASLYWLKKSSKNTKRILLLK